MRHRVKRVRDEIEQRQFELHRVDVNQRKRIRHGDLGLDTAPGQARSDELANAIDDVREARRLPTGRLPRLVEHAADDASDLLDLCVDGVEPLAYQRSSCAGSSRIICTYPETRLSGVPTW